jgi:hypothetical protein
MILIFSRDDFAQETVATVIGYGSTFSDGAGSSSVLLETTNTIVPFTFCNDIYGIIADDKQICFGGEAGRDICSGDRCAMMRI